ncbi:MAG: DUF928 domain-containing protein [Spirulina sp.]
MFRKMTLSTMMLTSMISAFLIVPVLRSYAASTVEFSLKNGGGGNSSSSSATSSGRPTLIPLGRRGGQCDRQDTYANLPALMILRPSDDSRAITHEAFPTFLIYTPVDITPQSQAVFTLETVPRDLTERREEIFTQKFDNVPGNSVISVTLTEQTARSLSPGQKHNVIFRIYCGGSTERPSTNTIVARSTVTRTVPMNEQRAWYDALVYASNNDFDMWVNLLREEGLGAIPETLSNNSD